KRIVDGSVIRRIVPYREFAKGRVESSSAHGEVVEGMEIDEGRVRLETMTSKTDFHLGGDIVADIARNLESQLRDETVEGLVPRRRVRSDEKVAFLRRSSEVQGLSRCSESLCRGGWLFERNDHYSQNGQKA